MFQKFNLTVINLAAILEIDPKESCFFSSADSIKSHTSNSTSGETNGQIDIFLGGNALGNNFSDKTKPGLILQTLMGNKLKSNY